QPVSAVTENVSERAGEHAHLTVESDHAAECTWMFLPGILLFDKLVAIAALGDEWERSVRGKCLRQDDGPGPRSAAAMRARNRLVQVDVHCVDAKVTGPDLADNCVEVRAVTLNERACRVH